MSDKRSATDRRRRHRRYQTAGVTCDLGELLDLSRSGVRVACDGKPTVVEGERATLTLTAIDGAVRVTGHVVWIRRTGVRRREIGIAFVTMPPDTEAALESLASFGSAKVTAEDQARFDVGGREPRRPVPQQPDYYDMLSVSPTATAEQIQVAFRTLAHKYHPDQSGDATTVDRFIRITKAYNILKDPQRRRDYDRSRTPTPT
ncbi:MAG: DnaJ domain-containing protein [Phycisphaerales bacterium]|nr:DnaJ domain-containing protein [Phycisphaerales bacterium]